MKKNPPRMPGEVLQNDYIAARKMTQAEVAQKTGISLQTINLIVNGKRNITAETALAFSKVFKTKPLFWMNLQNHVDLWNASHKRH